MGQKSGDLPLLDYTSPIFMAALRHHVGLKLWSWNELATRTGISGGSILGWRQDKSRPMLDNVEALCRAFGVSLSEFFAKGEEIVAKERVEAFQKMNPEDFVEWYEGLDEAQKRRVVTQLVKIKGLAEQLQWARSSAEEKDDSRPDHPG